MTDRARLLRTLLRDDRYAFMQRVFMELEPTTRFLPNWHYQHLWHTLGRVERGEVRRLIVNVPPRSGKSLLASVAWPMHLLGHDPSKRLICVSYAESLARTFSISRRTIAMSAWYRDLFPDMELTTRRPRDLELRTTAHGYAYAAGVGGAVLGRGADIVILDDPIKPLEALSEAGRRRVNEFYDNTLISRLNDKKTGVIVIVMQRLHEEDLVGHVMERGDWEVVSLPAIAVEDTRHALSAVTGDVYVRKTGEVLHDAHEPMKSLDETRAVQGSLIFSAQYQQEPVPADGALIRREWLRWYDEPPAFEEVVISWDTASTENPDSDYSAGTVWGVDGLDYYLLEVVRERMHGPTLRQRVVELSRRYQANATLVEETELGRFLEQDLRYSRELRIQTCRPVGDKYSRLAIQAARFEAGQVHLPRDAPWLDTYLKELLAFPVSKKKDQVDSTSQALKHLTRLTYIRHPELMPEEAKQPIQRRKIIRRSFRR